MARMYSRRRGRSGSHKPIEKKVPEWLSYQAQEVEQLVVKLTKQEKTASQIGLILRDTYGIPSVKTVTGKRITDLLKEKSLAKKLPEDLLTLIHTHINVMKHVEDNPGDMVAKRGVVLTESKIRRLSKYYKNKKLLTSDWAYDRTKAKLYLE